MRYYLAAIFIALASAATSVSAQPYRIDMPQKPNAAPWAIWRGMGTEGNHLACMASLVRPDGIGLNLIKSVAGAWYIGTTNVVYGLSEQARDSGATLTLDPGVLGRGMTVRTPAQNMGENVTLMTMPKGVEPGSMTPWLGGVAAGHMTRIVVNSRFVDFDLTGSAGAIDAIEKCHAFRRSYRIAPEGVEPEDNTAERR